MADHWNRHKRKLLEHVQWQLVVRQTSGTFLNDYGVSLIFKSLNCTNGYKCCSSFSNKSMTYLTKLLMTMIFFPSGCLLCAFSHSWKQLNSLLVPRVAFVKRKGVEVKIKSLQSKKRNMSQFHFSQTSLCN